MAGLSRLVLIIAVTVFVSSLPLEGCSMPASQATVPPSDNISPVVPEKKAWPRINSFTASAVNIKPGENVTLTWDVSDASVVTIDAGIGTVLESGSVNVSPQKTTKYILTAASDSGMAQGWVTIEVASKSKIMPDLVITGITYNSGLLYYTVKNIGGADAGPGNTYLYDLSHMHRDISWVDGLTAGEEKTLPFTNYDYKGTEITVCADGGNDVTEANEDNNCFVPTFGFRFNYDFSQYASRATWRSSAGRVMSPAPEDSKDGAAFKANSVIAEDGKTYPNALEMVPPYSSYGWIEGLFGEWQESWQAGGYMLPLEIPHNTRFTAKVGLTQNAGGSRGVAFMVGLMEGGNYIEWWPGVKVYYDGKLDSMEIDLSPYAGRKGILVLRVEAGADPDKNYALWIDAKLTQ